MATGPAAGLKRVEQQRQAHRLVVDDAEGQLQRHGHGAGEKAHVYELAAAADASQVEHGGGGHAHQQDELR